MIWLFLIFSIEVKIIDPDFIELKSNKLKNLMKYIINFGDRSAVEKIQWENHIKFFFSNNIKA